MSKTKENEESGHITYSAMIDEDFLELLMIVISTTNDIVDPLKNKILTKLKEYKELINNEKGEDLFG